MSQFSDDIKRFNFFYGLQVSEKPTTTIGQSSSLGSYVDLIERLNNFKRILVEEVDEVEEIIIAAQSNSPRLDILTALADWLGDIQIYCASEMAKFGLPLDAILNIIMLSNFSKLGDNGKPIYDERGKVQKGPNYFRPEQKIRECLEQLSRL